MGNFIRTKYEGVFVNGEWISCPDSEINEIVNPATEEKIGSAVVGSVNDWELAISAAREAFDLGEWRNFSCRQRADALGLFLDELEKNALEIIGLIVSESGHSYMVSSLIHFKATIEIVRHQLEICRVERTTNSAVFMTQDPFGIGDDVASASQVIRKPLGVVAAVVPFNAPFMLSILKIIPALAMGNTVVLKASELTPLQSLILGDVALSARLPRGILNVITGDKLVGELISRDPRVDCISFTGSDHVGSIVMEQSAPTLKRLILELGGKSASVVMPDADIRAAAIFGASMATTMSGQGCALCTRHIVHNSILPEYLDALRRALWGMSIGDTANPYNAMGPLINAKQLERVEHYVEVAKSEGGSIICGGKRPIYLDKGFFYEPTVIVGLDPNSKVCQDEIFGPVLVVLGFDTQEEAVQIANNTRYGLSGAVFTSNRGNAIKLASSFESGQVSINPSGVAIDVTAPFGGIKRSGFGREWGVEGLNEFSYQQTTVFPVG